MADEITIPAIPTGAPSPSSSSKIVQLKNKAGENIYPVTPEDGKATIEVTDTDPGEGVALQENHFIAVYGDATKVQTDEIADSAITTAKIADGAVTSDKIDWATLRFGAVQIADAASINIKRSYPCEMLLIGSASTWGYGGNTVTVSISASTTPTSWYSMSAQGTQGNTVSRSLVAFAYGTLKANTTYTFNLNISNGGGQTGGSRMVAILFRTG